MHIKILTHRFVSIYVNVTVRDLQKDWVSQFAYNNSSKTKENKFLYIQTNI